jgi:hypothetical protein
MVVRQLLIGEVITGGGRIDPFGGPSEKCFTPEKSSHGPYHKIFQPRPHPIGISEGLASRHVKIVTGWSSYKRKTERVGISFGADVTAAGLIRESASKAIPEAWKTTKD